MHEKANGDIIMWTKLLFILCFLYAPLSLAQWTLKKNYDTISIYTSPNQTRLAIQYKKTKKKDKQITKDLIAKLEQTKKQMLQKIGIKKWQMNKSHIEQINEVTQVTLSGSYWDSAKEKVYFTEYHFYSPSQKLQLLLTNNKKRNLNRDAQMSNIQNFREKYDL